MDNIFSNSSKKKTTSHKMTSSSHKKSSSTHKKSSSTHKMTVSSPKKNSSTPESISIKVKSKSPQTIQEFDLKFPEPLPDKINFDERISKKMNTLFNKHQDIKPFLGDTLFVNIFYLYLFNKYKTNCFITKHQNIGPEMEIIMDIPVILNDIRYEDKYDSDFKERRAIVWTLDLTLKGYIYGPVKKSGIIKFVNTTFYIPSVPDGTLADSVGNTSPAERVTVQPGLLSNGSPVSWYGAANSSTGTIPYAEIEANNDFGYITQIYNTDELE